MDEMSFWHLTRTNSMKINFDPDERMKAAVEIELIWVQLREERHPPTTHHRQNVGLNLLPVWDSGAWGESFLAIVNAVGYF